MTVANLMEHYWLAQPGQNMLAYLLQNFMLHLNGLQNTSWMPSGWRCARAFKKIENAACFLLFRKEIWKQKHWPWQASCTKFSSRQKHYKSNQNNPVYVFVFMQAARIALKDLIFIAKGMFLNHQDLERVASLVQISSSSFAICLTPQLPWKYNLFLLQKSLQSMSTKKETCRTENEQ